MKNNKPEKQKENREIFICRHCGNKTSHLLLYRHVIEVPLNIYDNEYKEITADDFFFLFECTTCKGISLKHVFSEEIDFDPDIGYDVPFENIDYLYPVTRLFDEEIPSGLNLVIKEANKVKLISSTAYLILIRKVMEELCRDRGIKENNLKNSLNKLVKIEKLPDIFREAINNLRLLGNIGAHESKIEITKAELKLVEEFIIALIEYIYIMPSKLQKLNIALNKQVKKT